MPPPDLPPAVSGERHDLQTPGRRLSYYADRPAAAADARPLLLVHSINAAGSAYEIRPLYEHYRRLRPVYALELPGFGFSDRRDEEYADTAGGHHAANHGGAHDLAGYRSGTARDPQRYAPQDESERCHEDWPKAQARTLERRLGQRSPFLEFVLGELDDENRVFGG